MEQDKEACREYAVYPIEVSFPPTNHAFFNRIGGQERIARHALLFQWASCADRFGFITEGVGEQISLPENIFLEQHAPA